MIYMVTPEKPPPLTPQLLLAKSIAEEMGRKTQHGKAATREGKEVPILLVSHGDKWVMVRQDGNVAVEFTHIDIPDEIKTKLQKLPKEIQERIMRAMKVAILSKGRIGWIYTPPGATAVGDLRAIILAQVIRLSRSDQSCYNRFADAIQELVNATIEQMLILGSGTLEDSAPSKPPEPGMYA